MEIVGCPLFGVQYFRNAFRGLMSAGSIETENEEEVRMDVEAVLKEYLRREREVVEEAKNRMESRGLGYGHLGRVKSQVAKEHGAPQTEDIRTAAGTPRERMDRRAA